MTRCRSCRTGSLAKRRLYAKKNRPDESGDDYGDSRLKNITLRLLDASAPVPQVLKISTQLPSVCLFDPERGQDRTDSFQNRDVNILVTKPLLLGQRFDNDGPDIRGVQDRHRLMIRAIFSNVRFPK